MFHTQFKCLDLFMPSFAKKIKLDDTLKELFLSFLLNGKYEAPPFSREQEKLVCYISEQFLISGFILDACDFNLSHKSLVEQIKHQRKSQLIKQMLVKNDLKDITHNLNGRCIEHVFLKGVALNADGIHSSGIRFSRDIDLLVRLDLLDEAYDVLKRLGFKYLNPKTQDSTKYHHFGHHLPEMINENNTKLELHWRVTRPSEFKDCPLAEKMLDGRRISKAHPHIFCPKIETMIAHLIYHGFKQHRMNLGPTILFDLAAIFVFFGEECSVDRDLLKRLGIEKEFDLCERFVKRVRTESRLSAESKLLSKKIFKNSRWLVLSNESKVYESSIGTSRIKIFDNPSLLSRLLFKIRSTRTFYQVSYFSPKFWLFFITDILTSLKKVILAVSTRL